jgi:Tol biopolymer transport system component
MRHHSRVRLTLACLASFLALAGLATSRSAEEDPAVRLERAVQLETVDGDLETAIAEYEQIIENNGNSRALAARALLRLGGCYEKLGRREARKVYQRLVDDYADQSEQVSVARSRLAALTGEKPPTLTVRRLENPPADAPSGAPSPDGRYLSFVDWRTGDLAIQDLRNGQDRRLTHEGTEGMEDPPEVQLAEESTWSPDSRQIAYVWHIGGRQELRAVGLDAGQPRVLFSRGSVGVRCADWSPDGKQVLVALSRENGSLQLVLVSTAGSSMRELTTIERRIYPAAALFSPDGRSVAYDDLPDEASPQRDILRLSLENGQTTPLIRHPADDFLLGWSADGKWLVFASDRAGALGLWVVRVAGGETHGAPRLIKEGIGRILPMGLTRQGTLFYGVVTATEDVYVADLDPETGLVAEPARKAIETNEGANFTPSFSPDGKSLAYVTRGGNSPYPTNVGNALCIRSLDTGRERVFYREIWRLGYRWIGGPSWSPDGRFVTFGASRGVRPEEVLRIDLETNEISTVLRAGPDDVLMHGVYGPDGQHFFAYGDKKNGVTKVVARDLATGDEQELYRFPTLERGVRVSLSPDGRWLAFMNAGWGAERVLRVVPASGGAARELWNFGATKPGTPGGSHTWSPDGQYILFSQPDYDDLPHWVLWRAPIGGGPPEKLGLDQRWGIDSLTVHPDGSQIAMAGRGGPSTSSEVWMMDNFLPESETAAWP